MKNPYKILGCPESASKEEINKKYKVLAFKYHPDKNINMSTEDKKINEDWQPDKSKWSLYKKAQWWIEERLYNLIGSDPYDRIKEWLITEPASNGLAIFLALLIIFFD